MTRSIAMIVRCINMRARFGKRYVDFVEWMAKEGSFRVFKHITPIL